MRINEESWMTEQIPAERGIFSKEFSLTEFLEIARKSPTELDELFGSAICRTRCMVPKYPNMFVTPLPILVY